MSMDTTAAWGSLASLRVIGNPDSAFSTAEFSMTYNPAVFYIAEALAVEKGVALSGWGMNVDIDNDNGTLLVTLDGTSAATMPAELFTVHFSVRVGSTAGTYNVNFTVVKFDGTATTSLQSGKITVTSTGDGGVVVPTRGGGGCFVATAAFGSMSADTVSSLCAVRDSSVAASSSGSSLVALYYSVSPATAAHTASSVRALVRRFAN
jgi:hypothetical protein